MSAEAKSEYYGKTVIRMFSDRLEFEERDAEDVMRMKYSLKDREYDGLYETFWSGGHLKEKGMYRAGRKVGVYIWYSPDGSIWQQFDHGERNT